MSPSDYHSYLHHIQDETELHNESTLSLGRLSHAMNSMNTGVLPLIALWERASFLPAIRDQDWARP